MNFILKNKENKKNKFSLSVSRVTFVNSRLKYIAFTLISYLQFSRISKGNCLQQSRIFKKIEILNYWDFLYKCRIKYTRNKYFFHLHFAICSLPCISLSFLPQAFFTFAPTLPSSSSSSSPPLALAYVHSERQCFLMQNFLLLVSHARACSQFESCFFFLSFILILSRFI